MPATETHQAIALCTREIHDLLASRAHLLGEVKCVNPKTLRGLCATGAVLLIEHLAARGIDARLVVARSVFGNEFHYWVLADGLHADPTYGQFHADEPWRVSTEAPRLVFGDYVDKPTTWAVEDEVVPWFEQQPSRFIQTFRN
jgi:hypothetical protein